MRFDVICGNPPYQLRNGGGNGSSATPIYQKFVEQAKRLNSKYLTMIIPSRWMFGGIGLERFRNDMLKDKHIVVLFDYIDEHVCFPNNDVPGGVCYFLRDVSKEGMCEVHHITSMEEYVAYRFLSDSGDTFIRNPVLANIQKKVSEVTQDFMYDLVSVNRPYGFRRDFLFRPEKYEKYTLTEKPLSDKDVSILGLSSNQKRINKFVDRFIIIQSKESIDKYKLFIPAVYGCPAIGAKEQTPVIQKPVIGYPGDACTETFLMIGPFDSENEACNCSTYLCTKFARCMIGAQKQSQSASRIVYKFVPSQDFSKPWTDAELYEEYNLTQEEIDFIENVIKPMS